PNFLSSPANLHRSVVAPVGGGVVRRAKIVCGLALSGAVWAALVHVSESAEYAAKGIRGHLASRSGKVGLHPAQRSARGRGRVSPRLHQLDRRHASVFVGAAQVRQRALRQTVGVNNALAVGLAKIGAAVNLLPAANETGAC